jgi:hypothetical protein
MSNLDIATRNVAIYAVGLFQSFFVIRKAHNTIVEENSDAIIACAKYSGIAVINIMYDAKIWYPGKVKDVTPPIWFWFHIKSTLPIPVIE